MCCILVWLVGDVCSWKLLEERHTLNALGIVLNAVFSVAINMVLYKCAAP